ncbi:hypothetical protein [Enterococcus malodoratus]|uniref:hypothetical protein n=1 Tax=Enterococcus malodoratus TaxID=71451 RepID=UPI002073A24B|nr:hypothetical protein [Enterococcus malodoratus]
MPKFEVQTWVDIYSMLTDVFSLSHEQAFSDLSLVDLLQIAYNKQAYDGWVNFELNRLQEKGGK